MPKWPDQLHFDCNNFETQSSRSLLDSAEIVRTTLKIRDQISSHCVVDLIRANMLL